MKERSAFYEAGCVYKADDERDVGGTIELEGREKTCALQLRTRKVLRLHFLQKQAAGDELGIENLFLGGGWGC